MPWVPEDPFEGALDLEWPIEGLEPLSFVLGRLLEPLAERLERADRGAAVLHTHLRLVSKDVHARTLQLPAPMRDPKTLRTLMLLDLESNPPSAAIDRVRVLIEPTPARVTAVGAVRTRAAIARTGVDAAGALDGAHGRDARRLAAAGRFLEARRVRDEAVCSTRPRAPGSEGTPALGTDTQHDGTRHAASGTPSQCAAPFPLAGARPRAGAGGRPVRVMTDRRGVTGGAIVQAAGPWRTSGEWWNDGACQPVACMSHLLAP